MNLKFNEGEREHALKSELKMNVNVNAPQKVTLVLSSNPNSQMRIVNKINNYRFIVCIRYDKNNLFKYLPFLTFMSTAGAITCHRILNDCPPSFCVGIWLVVHGQ